MSEDEASTKKSKKAKKNEDRLLYVTPDNHTVLENNDMTTIAASPWYRATYMLVMHEPPHLYYEPKDWAHTCLVLLKTSSPNDDLEYRLELPGGPVLYGESYEESAVRRLRQDTNIDVCKPANCLHHLFTFPFEIMRAGETNEATANAAGIWGDCYECIYRGKLEDLKLPNALTMSLAEIKDMLEHATTAQQFVDDTCHALKLYFQRQGDLRAKRRLLKGYSSVDLDHYGLRSEQPLVLMDFNDNVRNQAVDFTMKTDDGMAPRLLHQAEIIILGVSRSGKTPLSIFMSQTAGLKVANIPLVFEITPPKELTDDPRIDPRRVFCLTRDVDELEKMRQSRLEKELKNSHVGGHSTYADYSYIRKDLAKARNLAKTKGYTEIDVSGRALEEVASLILSKMKERFPELHIN